MSEATRLTGSQEPYTRIKICGLRDIATIRAMHDLNIEAVGFIFAPSRRQVSAEQAAELIAEVRAWKARTSSGRAPLAVGVFVNSDLAALKHAVNTASLDVVQLHGSESPEDCEAAKQELGTEVWKVFHLGRGGETDEIDAQRQLLPYKGHVDAVLIDTAGGGTGTAFDWTVIARYKEAAAELGVPLYVAGGLSLDNVRSLVKEYSPDGVDVSSGVETEGIKDIDKIHSFVRKVWEA
ncbi:N-(5'-phosphoribosyl)anthranilate isomerase [Paenibacillus sp. CCS19]|uniref:phosphoribosylanthranilate isomerase n=1 Tax=Paenibacillus sp. CCS19 TaxID=3158387 RepID=UPI00255E22FB|nr:phosphoribosylanthranilate isomerase [Paenibacillus cellulosilyticus]GMK42191.1 N-(5'-phosphoribosyl)anthranilate isomerase [Paenibacillus cellulosilyticus]